MKPELTAVYLSNDDAIAFLMFQEYYEVFQTMVKSGIFEIGYGKATLNFAHNELQNIVKEEIAWKK